MSNADSKSSTGGSVRENAVSGNQRLGLTTEDDCNNEGRVNVEAGSGNLGVGDETVPGSQPKNAG